MKLSIKMKMPVKKHHAAMERDHLLSPLERRDNTYTMDGAFVSLIFVVVLSLWVPGYRA